MKWKLEAGWLEAKGDDDLTGDHAKRTNCENFPISSSAISLAVTVFAISLSAYLTTLLPGIGYHGDTTKFQFVGATLSVPHPTGFPTHLLLSWAFSKVPIRSLAYRANLLSAILGSVTVVTLFFIIRQITDNEIVAATSALIFAFSRTFWSQAIVAQVYTLAAFLLGLTILALLTWASRKKSCYFYLAWLSYSISLGTHPFVLTLLPGIVYFIIATDAKTLSKRSVLICLGFTALGVLQYLYIPLRASAMPIYSEIKSGSLKDFWVYMTYYPKVDTFKYGLAEIIGQRIPIVAQWWQQQFFLPGILIGLVGILPMARRSLRMTIFIVLAILGNAVMYLNHRSSNIFAYPVISYMLYTILIAVAFSSLWLRIGTHTQFRSALSTLVLCVLIAFPAALYVHNYPLVDQSENSLDGYFSELISQLDSNSVIMAPDYFWYEFLFYKLNVEGLRNQDNIWLIYQGWETADIQALLATGKIVYIFNRVESVEKAGITIKEDFSTPQQPNPNVVSLLPYKTVYKVQPLTQQWP